MSRETRAGALLVMAAVVLVIISIFAVPAMSRNIARQERIREAKAEARAEAAEAARIEAREREKAAQRERQERKAYNDKIDRAIDRGELLDGMLRMDVESALRRGSFQPYADQMTLVAREPGYEAYDTPYNPNFGLLYFFNGRLKWDE